MLTFYEEEATQAMHFADPVRPAERIKEGRRGQGRDRGLLTRQALFDKKVFPILSVIIQPAPNEHLFATTELLPSSRGSALKGTAGEIRLGERQSGQTYDALPKRQAREGAGHPRVTENAFELGYSPLFQVSFEKR